jgi:ABC-2 type transport system ATP-binding protein
MGIFMGNIIEVTDLTKYYGNFLAVDRINFEVKSQELFGFLGPNGAGKTTLLRTIFGSLRLLDGHIVMDNQCLDALGPAKAGYGPGQDGPDRRR